MKTCLWLVICSLVLAAFSAQAQEVPDISLPDPRGWKHNLQALARAGGLVLVISAPTLEDRSAQEAWSKLLSDTKGPDNGTFVMVEDMRDAFIKSIALHDMKEDWKPGDVPLLLVDNTGTLYSVLGVRSEETVVFVYDTAGKRIERYAGVPSRAQAEAIWGLLK